MEHLSKLAAAALLACCAASSAQYQIGERSFSIPGGGGGTTNHARAFNGSSGNLQSAASLAALSGLGSVSISFWMNWTSFSNNDALAFESSSNYNGNAGAFLIQPNSSSTGAFDFNESDGSGTGTTYLDCHFARPSAGAWHQYVLTWNGAVGTCTAYVDGVLQTVTIQPGVHTNFSAQTLNVMSRNGGSLFGAGSMSEIAIYSGTVNALDASGLAGCARATSVTSATLLYYWQINQVSPETPTTGSVNLTVNGTTNVASHCSF